MSEVIALGTHIWLWYVNGNFDREVLKLSHSNNINCYGRSAYFTEPSDCSLRPRDYEWRTCFCRDEGSTSNFFRLLGRGNGFGRVYRGFSLFTSSSIAGIGDDRETNAKSGAIGPCSFYWMKIYSVES